MPAAERRRSRRFKVSIPLRFHLASLNGHRARSINVSASGVCFETEHSFRVGQRIELELRIPKRITGTAPADRCFTGRVVYVKPNESHAGPLEVGVQFLYYESRRNHLNSQSSHATLF